MKSLIEAAIAILIVYLFLEYFKANQSVSATGGGSAGIGTAAGTSAGVKTCCCGGGGAPGTSTAPKPNPISSGPVPFNPITNIDFQTAPIVVQAVAPSPAPVPRQYYVVQGV